MTSRRAPSARIAKYADQQQDRQLQSMSPGAVYGRLASAQPVLDTAAQSLFGSEAGAGGASAAVRESQVDIFTLPSNGAQDLTLTFVPIQDSWNLLHNRLGMVESEHFTLAGKIVSLLTGTNPLTGDTIRVQYDYLAEQSDPIEDHTAGDWLFASGTGIFTQPTLPGGASAGQLGILYIAHDTANTITANGWTLRSTSAITYTFATTFDVYTKVLVGGDTMPAVAFVSNYSNIYVTAVNTTGLAYASVATPIQTAGGTSSTSNTPAVASGTVAVRGWFTNNGGVSPAGTLSPPGRGEAYTEYIPASTDGDLLVTIETDLTAATATHSQNPAWIGHTVGVQ